MARKARQRISYGLLLFIFVQKRLLTEQSQCFRWPILKEDIVWG